MLDYKFLEDSEIVTFLGCSLANAAVANAFQIVTEGDKTDTETTGN